MQFFVKAKAWHIFVLALLIPNLIQPLFSSLWSNDDPEIFARNILVSAFIIFILWNSAWLWSVGYCFHKKSHRKDRIGNLWVFSGCVYYSVIFQTLYLVFIFPQTLDSAENLEKVTASPVIFFAQMLGTLALIYAYYFVARELILAEENSENAPSFMSILLVVVMIMFFLVGIWFLQPRINRQFANNNGGDGDPDKSQYSMDM